MGLRSDSIATYTSRNNSFSMPLLAIAHLKDFWASWSAQGVTTTNAVSAMTSRGCAWAKCWKPEAR